MTMVVSTTIFVILEVASVFVFIDDKKVRRQALLQGIIVILCGITYGVYLNNYEKSKKLHSKRETASSDGPKSDISSSEYESKNNKKKD